ncbi:MAG: hypothetical protein GTO14_23725 [Anaerolineales bacterium]|nr:hypothetical protein [Anaerolineales bacterium]
MARQALFVGLVVDEHEQPVNAVVVGGEAFYVVDDGGFLRHIDSEYVDRKVLEHLQAMIEGHEDLITEDTMKMLGQDDIFTKAMIETQLKNMDAQFNELIEQGLPEEVRTYLGMVGFRIWIDFHGEVVKVEQPTAPDPDDRSE